MDLTVLERSWVEDECLRAENALVVTDELRIPGALLTSDSLMVGACHLLGERNERVLDVVTCADCDLGSAVVWSTPPGQDQDETVHIVYVGPEGLVTRSINGGADPGCAMLRDEIYVSWIRKVSGADTWDIIVRPLSVTLADSGPPIVVSGVSGLAYAPRLVRLNNELVVLYIQNAEAGMTDLVAHYLRDGIARTIRCVGGCLDLAYVVHRDSLLVAFPSIAARSDDELRTEIEFVQLRSHEWRRVQSPLLRSVRRLALASAGSDLVLACEFFDGALELITYDFEVGQILDRNLVSSHGKFPAVAADNGRVVLAWCGAPTEPREYQRARRRRLNPAALLDGLDDLRESWRPRLEAIHLEQGLEQSAAERRARDDTLMIDPWATLWLGRLDADGTVVPIEYSLGYGLRLNQELALSLDGGDGVLAWLSARDIGDGVVALRQIRLARDS